MSPRDRRSQRPARVLRQLRSDHRTIALLLDGAERADGVAAPTSSTAPPPCSTRSACRCSASFPFVTMFLVTSVAMLRERTSGTLERLLTTPMAKLDLLLGYAIAFALTALGTGGASPARWPFPPLRLNLDAPGGVSLVVLLAVANALLGMSFGLFVSAFAAHRVPGGAVPAGDRASAVLALRSADAARADGRPAAVDQQRAATVLCRGRDDPPADRHVLFSAVLLPIWRWSRCRGGRPCTWCRDAAAAYRLTATRSDGQNPAQAMWSRADGSRRPGRQARSMPAAGLELVGLRRTFGDVVALDGLTFSVPPGTLFGFVGRNGAGKTTTMRIVCGLLAADDGSVRGAASRSTRGCASGSATCRRSAGLPEDARARSARVLRRPARALACAARTAATEWLERLGLGDRAGSRIEQLSQGNQQRVQLAAALVHRPELLVLDEPFAGLDPIVCDLLTEVLREQAARGVPVLFSSHQLELVEHSANRWRSSTAAAWWPAARWTSCGRADLE